MVTREKMKRIESGKTQIQLQVETGISTSLISLYERGILSPPAKHAEKLNQALGQKVYAGLPTEKLRSRRRKEMVLYER